MTQDPDFLPRLVPHLYDQRRQSRSPNPSTRRQRIWWSGGIEIIPEGASGGALRVQPPSDIPETSHTLTTSPPNAPVAGPSTINGIALPV
ncbi:hypothetical protein GALMADRAFT_1111952 [Galerina marginata CBS 339.88]|uniref:Uncharacterized protein n=1 Tax=Galerina marginata (strain CBS 339.88) TaxID=685588 RepID=A0A067TCA6_GALM3|nr:hypothetical protein GALMADRAFT_1111952 [Galerina marginata CBS 339.88]